ncbi:MAG: lectin, partial [Vicinamibacterales bacterium]
MHTIKWTLVGALVLASTTSAQNQGKPPEPDRIPSSLMTFFVTSEGIGDGGNLGGLAGADAHCQKLAAAVGAGGKTWRAYLSTQARPGQPAVNARDRIGNGPWFSAKERVP